MSSRIASSRTRRRRRLTGAAVVATSVSLAACLELNVTNTDTPALGNIFNTAANLESAVGLSFRLVQGVTQGARDNATYPVVQLGALAEITTGTAGATFEVIQEPRVRYNNVEAGQWLARKPWYDLYEVIATSRDALRALEDGGVKVGAITAAAPNGADTPRARVFARMMMGLSYVYLGIMYDKAFLADETIELEKYEYTFAPYREVSDFGIRQLELAIAEARQAPTFTLPLDWVNQQTITRDELVRVMNGYLVRALVATARTPAERAAVNWTRVLQLTEPGAVITREFGQLADQTKAGTTSSWLQYTQLQTDARIDNVLVGPSDTSGTYQRWLQTPLAQRAEIQVRTPDRRIHAAGNPAARGKYFDQPTTQTMSTARGTYVLSRYRGVRYGTQYYQTGFIATMTPTEMDLVRAEALIRLNRAAEAVPLINKTRTATGTTGGELPPVTVAGTGSLPTCVPRKDNGSCGDLLDAMLYEKRIELHASMEPVLHWADWRAFGRLPSGSLMQLPVTGRELQTLGLPVYSFGGDLPGSAP
jgi:hypothetical protein